jgi:hypothetical protein
VYIKDALEAFACVLVGPPLRSLGMFLLAPPHPHRCAGKLLAWKSRVYARFKTIGLNHFAGKQHVVKVNSCYQFRVVCYEKG